MLLEAYIILSHGLSLQCYFCRYVKPTTNISKGQWTLSFDLPYVLCWPCTIQLSIWEKMRHVLSMISIRSLALALEMLYHNRKFNWSPFLHFEGITQGCFVQLCGIKKELCTSWKIAIKLICPRNPCSCAVVCVGIHYASEEAIKSKIRGNPSDLLNLQNGLPLAYLHFGAHQWAKLHLIQYG